MWRASDHEIIQVDDLFELKPDLTSEEVVKRWYPIWDKELISKELQSNNQTVEIVSEYQKDTEEFKRKAVVQRKKSTREAAMPLLESGGGRGYGGTNNGDAKKAKNKKKSGKSVK